MASFGAKTDSSKHRRRIVINFSPLTSSNFGDMTRRSIKGLYQGLTAVPMFHADNPLAF